MPALSASVPSNDTYFGVELFDLGTEGCEAPAGREANDSKLIREGAHDIQGLKAD